MTTHPPDRFRYGPNVLAKDQRGIMMSLMIALDVGLKLVQEAKADSAAAKLKAMISVTATAIRDGKPQEIAVSQLVPGDIKGIAQFTWLMLRFIVTMVPLVFVINGLSKGNWVEAFFFAVAVAVGLTPEMLPMIVTVCLSKGALAMSRKKVIVKRINAIQNLGAMDVLCTDKTGTLTMDPSRGRDQSRSSWPLIGMSVVIMATGIAIPFTPLGHYLGFTALPTFYWPLLALTLLCYVLLTQSVKMWLLRRRWI